METLPPPSTPRPSGRFELCIDEAGGSRRSGSHGTAVELEELVHRPPGTGQAAAADRPLHDLYPGPAFGSYALR